ncbi:MAG: tRNA dihydrouridine synthase DusB [Myxococcota bacterium]|nr:tRNA dihydrouridine synthase DusB [Myxococcota bacterium]
MDLANVPVVRIGEHELGPGATVAPMAGITNPPFRQLCRELGASLSTTELISCHALVYLHRKRSNRGRKLGAKILSLIEPYPGEQPLCVQIFGRDPQMMAEAARIAVGEGAEIIDLNFGCPARQVIKNGEGAGVALMRDPQTLTEIARQVVQAVEVPVTAKTRLGYSPSEKNAVDIARRLVDVGVQLLCIHGRTKDQGHSGPVDFDTLAEVVTAVSVPVIGNGGIRGRADAEEMLARTGCARVSIGQGAKGNPWIFREVVGGSIETSLSERLATCKRHLELYIDWIGESRAVLEMRKHAAWYLKGFDGAAVLRGRLGQAVDTKSFLALLDEVPVGESPPR